MEENMDESMKENTPATEQQTPPVYGEPQMQGQQTPPFYGEPQMQGQQTSPFYGEPQMQGQQTPPFYGEPQMQGQQTPPFYGNPQMQYQQVPPVYQNQYARKEKGDEIALGIASLLLFCTCVNVAMAIASVILGILQIVKNKNKVFSIVGFVTSGIAFILTILFVIGIIAFSSEEMNNNSTYYHLYDDIYNEMYDDYDFNSYDDIY